MNDQSNAAIEAMLPEAQKTLLALLDNLFFAAKINQAAAFANLRPVYSKSHIQALTLARTIRPVQIIVDLDASACCPMEFLTLLQNDQFLCTIPLLGFASHVHTDLMKHARKAGCDRILVRSAFDRDLKSLLSQIS